MSTSSTSTLGLLSAALAFSSSTFALRAASPWDSPPRIQKRITCEDVHIFLARGGNEPYPGRQGTLVNDICAGQSSSACGYEDIIFDATIGVDFGTQMYDGASSGVMQITNYADACPASKLVLSGYSLGAGVVGDLLAGSDAGDLVYGSPAQYLAGIVSSTSSPGNQIAAVLLFGDVRHVAGQSYNVLSGADDSSSNPRPSANLAKLNNFADVMRSYCDGHDPVCAKGDDSSVHTSYFELYSIAAASWVRSMVGVSVSAKATATVIADGPATSSGAAVVESTSAATTASTRSSAVSSETSASTSATTTGAVIVTPSASTSAAAATTATSTGAAASTSASSAASAGPISLAAGVAGLVGVISAWLIV